MAAACVIASAAAVAGVGLTLASPIAAPSRGAPRSVRAPWVMCKGYRPPVAGSVLGPVQRELRVDHLHLDPSIHVLLDLVQDAAKMKLLGADGRHGDGR